MARHTTHKRTTEGKRQTLARKAARRAKRATTLDLDALARELHGLAA